MRSSVAIAALRTPALREVVAADHSEVLRLLAKRNIDIGNHRTRVVCRLHNLLMELAPGGIAKELNASDAVALLERFEPASPVEAARRDQAAELLADVQRLDEQLKASHRRIRTAVAASATSLTELFGVGPIIACYLIGFTGDINRFANRDAYAAYNGTAPVERSSGRRVVHRVSNAATGASTTPCTSPRSARSASPARRSRLLRAQAHRGQDQEGRRSLVPRREPGESPLSVVYATQRHCEVRTTGFLRRAGTGGRDARSTIWVVRGIGQGWTRRRALASRRGRP